MNDSEQQYLRDLLTYLVDVETFTVNGQDSFLRDRKTQFAVIRAYEVIGEIIKRLPDGLLASQPQMDWRRLVRYRDFLAHNYEKIDLNYVWAAVEDLPNLRAAVEAMLADLGDAGDEETES
ncbi:MAG: DUF86 domain-containing protein [Anaerolineaceae bacterium]|nr:DUF86 domain-containing protein [Anaerolineaceae bacterium]